MYAQDASRGIESIVSALHDHRPRLSWDKRGNEFPKENRGGQSMSLQLVILRSAI